LPALLSACLAPVGNWLWPIATVAGLMSNTIQYTYGVIGASESSTTIANDLAVCVVAPDHCSGGLNPAPWQVYSEGSETSEPNTGLVTVSDAGELSRVPLRPPNIPQPLTRGASAISIAGHSHRLR